MKKIIALFLMSFLISLSATSQSKKQLKKEKQQIEFTELKKLIEKKAFQFEADWATALGGGRFNLIGNPNFLTIRENEVEGDLPYFGVSHTAVGFSSGDVGIRFKGAPQEFEIKIDEKKRRIRVHFWIESKESERFEVILTAFPNNTADVVITSNKRNSINYNGHIKPLEEK